MFESSRLAKKQRPAEYQSFMRARFKEQHLFRKAAKAEAKMLKKGRKEQDYEVKMLSPEETQL